MTTKKILNSSESVEWYTPARYVEAVREVLGGIELDPASCAEAQETIKAERYFTNCDVGNDDPWNTPAHRCDPAIEVCDGLVAPWLARSVFLNPPYGTMRGKLNQALWSSRLQLTYEDGNGDHVGSAILLVSACTSETWFQPLWQYPICFTDHRIKYNYPKLRRFPLTKELRYDKERRRCLAKKPVRVWIDSLGWLSDEGGYTRDPDQARVTLFWPAYKPVAAPAQDNLVFFDLMDKPTQPTKGSAFVYFGSDPLTFAYKFQQFGPVVQAMKIHAGPRRHRAVEPLPVGHNHDRTEVRVA